VCEAEDCVAGGETALVADPGDAQALATGPDVVFGDRQHSAAVGAALAWREFDIGRHGRRLHEFIQELRAKKLRRGVENGRAGR
jgi:hypothetical protein